MSNYVDASLQKRLDILEKLSNNQTDREFTGKDNFIIYRHGSHGNAHLNASYNQTINQVITSDHANSKNAAPGTTTSHANGHVNHSNQTYDTHTNTFSNPNTPNQVSTLNFTGGQHTQSVINAATYINSARMGVSGGSGVLSELKGYIATVRADSANATPNGNEFTGTEISANTSNVNSLLDSAYITTKPRYRHGKTVAKVNVNICGQTSTLSKDAPETQNDETTPNKAVSYSFSAKSQHRTAPVTHTLSLTVPQAGQINTPINTDLGDVSFTRGTPIKKSDIEQLLGRIKKVSANTVSPAETLYYGRSDGTTATYTVLHTNTDSHGNHSVHANDHKQAHNDCSKLLKEDICSTVIDALELLKKVEVVDFNYKEGYGYDTSIRHTGFIAEDTPEELSTQYHDRMDFTNCIGILIKAVQQLDNKIENLSK